MEGSGLSGTLHHRTWKEWSTLLLCNWHTRPFLATVIASRHRTIMITSCKEKNNNNYSTSYGLNTCQHIIIPPQTHFQLCNTAHWEAAGKGGGGGGGGWFGDEATSLLPYLLSVLLKHLLLQVSLQLLLPRAPESLQPSLHRINLLHQLSDGAQRVGKLWIIGELFGRFHVLVDAGTLTRQLVNVQSLQRLPSDESVLFDALVRFLDAVRYTVLRERLNGSGKALRHTDAVTQERFHLLKVYGIVKSKLFTYLEAD